MGESPPGSVETPDQIEVELPEGFTLVGAEPPEPPPAEAKGEVPPPTAAAPAKESEPPKGDLKAALREERGRRKKYQGLWKQVEEERERMRSTGTGAPAAVDHIVPFVPEPKIEELAKAAEEAGADASAPWGRNAKLVVGLARQLAETGLKNYHENLRLALWRQRISDQEALVKEFIRDRGEDYDELLAKAGIYAALETVGPNQYRDPAVASKVFGAPVPAMMAYRLAKAKLEGDEPEPPEPEPAPATSAASPPPAPTVVPPEAEAERRGAQQVIEKVTANAGKPRSIRHVPAAAQPARATLTRADLDRMMETDPEGYLVLIEKNPRIKAFHLGGLPL